MAAEQYIQATKINKRRYGSERDLSCRKGRSSSQVNKSRYGRAELSYASFGLIGSPKVDLEGTTVVEKYGGSAGKTKQK